MLSCIKCYQLMGFKFNSKRIFKLLGFSLIIPFTFFEINTINKQIKAENKLIAASKKDLDLYHGMGVSYLCNATKKGYDMDFSKTLSVASATFVSVIQQKHGGIIIERNKEEKVNLRNLQYLVTLNLTKSAIDLCPDNVPDKVKKAYDIESERIMKLQKLKD